MSAAATTVTVIGLGLMGSALARAFSRAGHRLTVWSRTGERRAAFQGAASVADSVQEACAASEVIVVSVRDYRVSNSLLRSGDVEDVLAGKTLVQLSTGTPAEARDSEAWADLYRLAYLDGAITTYPRGIDRGTATILFAGRADVFEKQKELLGALGKPTFCGEEVGLAATLDLALLELAYAQGAALLHAAALCTANSVPLDVFFAHAQPPTWLLELATRHEFAEEQAPIDAATAAAALARPRRYRESVDATLNTHAAAVGLIAQASREAGLDAALPSALHDCFRRAAAQGHGSHDVPALYEAFFPAL